MVLRLFPHYVLGKPKTHSAPRERALALRRLLRELAIGNLHHLGRAPNVHLRARRDTRSRMNTTSGGALVTKRAWAETCRC